MWSILLNILLVLLFSFITFFAGGFSGVACTTAKFLTKYSLSESEKAELHKDLSALNNYIFWLGILWVVCLVCLILNIVYL